MDRKKKIKTNSDIFHPTLRKTLWFLIDWSLMWFYQNLSTEPENCSLLATCEQLSLWKLVLRGWSFASDSTPKSRCFSLSFYIFFRTLLLLKSFILLFQLK